MPKYLLQGPFTKDGGSKRRQAVEQSCRGGQWKVGAEMLAMPFLVSLAFAGCVTTSPVPIRTFEEQKALPAPAESREIAVTKLVSKLERSQQIGTSSGGLLCVPLGPMIWRPGLDEPVTGEVISVLRDELKKAGYRVAGLSGALFEESSEAQAELALAGAIKHVTLNACSGPQGRSSESSVEIEWQLYDRRLRAVVLTATTGGHAKASPGERDAYLAAYAVALRNLLAQESFTAAVGRSAVIATAPEYPPLTLPVVTVRPPDAAHGRELLEHAQSAVVRIPRGDVHGSGVVVSATGWVLTAAHVVAGLSGSFDVELADGQRVRGSILRSNGAADVALIQLPKGMYAAAPIGSSMALKVGSSVFAVSTPLGERFSRSVTKGIVSALRPKDGRTLIQSDVVVHAGSSGGPLLDEHGRVVGLTIGGAGIGGIGVGLNEFLATDDAWRALQVEPQVSTVETEALLRR